MTPWPTFDKNAFACGFCSRRSFSRDHIYVPSGLDEVVLIPQDTRILARPVVSSVSEMVRPIAKRAMRRRKVRSPSVVESRTDYEEETRETMKMSQERPVRAAAKRAAEKNSSLMDGSQEIEIDMLKETNTARPVRRPGQRRRNHGKLPVGRVFTRSRAREIMKVDEDDDSEDDDFVADEDNEDRRRNSTDETKVGTLREDEDDNSDDDFEYP